MYDCYGKVHILFNKWILMQWFEEETGASLMQSIESFLYMDNHINKALFCLLIYTTLQLTQAKNICKKKSVCFAWCYTFLVLHVYAMVSYNTNDKVN